ncbi:LPS assembly protein LptD [Thiomicrorhabdus sp. zzn3]|uniref:LPS-assembly protein LptD n=1 Tax=Thiomicrorhabdus sp. zzn3 TaxID=3039775 RepID=UPI002436595D|nr:LPS assembly protein LptD [Thiomicrorhabdus sp. zzn3]MDG6777482.1 LPS assembly protein LptD [Thiomicrorhabdus sp. zzn3]
MSNRIVRFYRLFQSHQACSNCKVITLSASVALLSQPTLAQTQPLLPVAEQRAAECLPQWIAQPIEVPAEQTDQTTPQATQMEADRLTQPDQNEFRLTGSAEVHHPGSVLLADEIRYRRDTQQAQASGQVELHRNDLLLTAQHAKLDNQQQTAKLQHTRYQLIPSRTHGHAKTIDLNQQKEVAHLHQATLTTCPIQNRLQDGTLASENQEQVAWQLKFDDLEINNHNRRVIGKHTTLLFHDVPIFYTPYFDYPLDDRASGLLFPEFGGYKAITEDRSSFYVKLPYYFNLAPNYDDTLTLMYMENRGPILENEFRYLAKSGSVRHQAEFTATFLNDQQTASEGLAYLLGDDVVYGEPIEQRWRGKLLASQQWAPGLTSQILWHETSDENFFSDIPVENALKTVTSTPRYVTLNYRDAHWQAYTQLYSYLRLRDAPVNYEKRPEVGARYQNEFGDFQWSVLSEATEFDVPLSSHNKPEALRARLVPEIRYGMYQPWGNLQASVTANHLRYSIHDNGNYSGDELDIEHTVMQYALRGGLVFERDFDFSGVPLIQTLEPELQYLHVPYVDQSDVPLFDTTNKSLHFSNLFALNRFSGYDRIGDTTQVSAALTSKILNQNGTPLLEAGIGQIFYLDDRQVSLSGNTLETAEQSDYFVKLGVTAQALYFYSTSQFSQEDTDLVNSNSRLRWDLSDTDKVLVNYTLTDNNLPTEQATLGLGATFEIANKWQGGAYWNYDFTQEIRNEVQYALRYDDCCWAGEFSVEETQLENGLYNYSFQFMIELKGLSTSGRTFKDTLSRRLNF